MSKYVGITTTGLNVTFIALTVLDKEGKLHCAHLPTAFKDAVPNLYNELKHLETAIKPYVYATMDEVKTLIAVLETQIQADKGEGKNTEKLEKALNVLMQTNPCDAYSVHMRYVNLQALIKQSVEDCLNECFEEISWENTVAVHIAGQVKASEAQKAAPPYNGPKSATIKIYM